MPHIHMVQLDSVWEDRPASRDRATALFESLLPEVIAPGDLVVLPEMWETGFSMHVERTADTDGTGAQWLAQCAQQMGITIVGGITVLEDGAPYARNRSLVFGANGTEIARYDKVHPFSFGREAERFEGGNRIALFEWAGLWVCPFICYDLRFPELFRAAAGMGAEAFVLIANWPAPRAAHWRALAIARAIENQAYMVSINRAGNDPHLSYAGGSIAVCPEGNVLAEADEQEQVLSVEIDADRVRAWREKFPALCDRVPALQPAVNPDGSFDRSE